jgi:hypothetical protein
MTPAGMDRPTTVVRSREELLQERKRRQTYTFLSVCALVFVVGLVALGNWQAWWTIGGSAAAAVACPAQTVTEPELTNVNVMNGTTRAGLATAVAKELQKRKFRVLTILTEEQRKPIKAVVLVRYGPPGKAAAHTVALQFPAKVTMVAVKRDTEEVDVVIGDRYRTMVSAKKAAAAIKPKEEPRGCVHATTAPPVP